MYTPKPFEFKDQSAIEEFIAAYPFATVISSTEDVPLVSHLPINRFKSGGLHGHFAAANPHSKVPDESHVTLLFQGPHAYVSPRYYRSDFNVPTWNYASVRCSGSIRFIDDADLVWDLFHEMVQIYEGEDGWGLPDEEGFRRLLPAIRFFRIDDVKLSGTLKYNQNKSVEDVHSVVTNLRSSGQIEAAEFMCRVNNLKGE